MKILTHIKSVLSAILCAMMFIFTILAGPHLQSHYLQYSVGSQTFFIKNPPGAKIRGSATGFAIRTEKGNVYTLTNAHVCGLQHNGYVMVGDGPYSESFQPKRVIKIYRDSDLCLVEGMQGYSGLSMAADYDIGDLNYVIGYPLGEEQNFSQGYLKNKVAIVIPENEVSLDKCNGPYQFIQSVDTLFGELKICVIKRYSVATSIAIWPGNSGSAMVNAFGHVTGVIFAGDNQTSWGYAIPLEDVRNFLRGY